MNQVLIERQITDNCIIQIVKGDITEETSDAIVNAANRHLQHGGGVAGAIAQKGGPQIQKESDAWIHNHGLVKHDKPAYTNAGKLPSKFVIHTVGPIWGTGNENQKLHDAIYGSLKTAESLDIKTLSMPAISTGIFGFPKRRAAKITFATIQEYFAKNPNSRIETVRIVLFDRPTTKAFTDTWEKEFAITSTL